MTTAFQDLIEGNHCFGCGRDNPQGLRIKSLWDGAETICHWTPQPWHCASPAHVVNGGIIATLLDCHAIISSMAFAAREAGQALGDGSPQPWYVTGKLDVQYLRPTPLGPELLLHARFEPQGARKILVHCTLSAGPDVFATAQVLAVAVSAEWMRQQ